MGVIRRLAFSFKFGIEADELVNSWSIAK